MRYTMLTLRHYIWPLLMFSGWWGLLRKMGTPVDVLASPGIATLGCWSAFLLLVLWFGQTLAVAPLAPVTVQIRWGSRGKVLQQFSIRVMLLVICMLLAGIISGPVTSGFWHASLNLLTILMISVTTEKIAQQRQWSIIGPTVLGLISIFWPLLVGQMLISGSAFGGRLMILVGLIVIL
ncbi:hypothetical protein [Schleiferilactobacillus harbinensis]|uniref:hypothetical protein n=1 Tax=Schleiferilactobacillus harbinensis TaxID=304207 RepID=UPI00345F0AC8